MCQRNRASAVVSVSNTPFVQSSWNSLRVDLLNGHLELLHTIRELGGERLVDLKLQLVWMPSRKCSESLTNLPHINILFRQTRQREDFRNGSDWRNAHIPRLYTCTGQSSESTG